MRLRGIGGGITPDSALYSTSFPNTEDPIVDGNHWLLGLADGLDWTNPRTLPGLSYPQANVGQPGNAYNDSIAVLKTSFIPVAADQWVEGTAYRVPGYWPTNSFGGAHESELLVRGDIPAHGARFYECTMGIDVNHTTYFFIVRWNGDGSFTTLISPKDLVGSYTNTPNAAATGQVIRAQVVGSTINVYQDGALIVTASDSTYATGQPGFGHWGNYTDITPSSYGWSKIRLGAM